MIQDTFSKLFLRYIKEELANYDEWYASASNEEILRWLYKELLPSGTKLYPITADNKQIGFVLIGLKGMNCHPLCDCFIIHAYVLPEYRCKGHMSNALYKIFEEYQGIYCYDVFNKNEIGKRFWRNFVERNHFQKVFIEEVRENPGDVTLYAFRVKNIPRKN